MNQTDWDECFLLHQRTYGETSLIVDLFSKMNGKISLIARGAKKPKSKFFGYLVPFIKIKVTYSGRSELKTLTNIDTDLSNIANNMSKKSYSLLYINELLIKLLPKNATHEELFLLYEEFIKKFFTLDDVEITLRHFELDLLDLLGYGFDYSSEFDNNEPISKEKDYKFIPERGFRELSGAPFSGIDITNIKNRELSKVSKKYLKELTQSAIHFCLDGRDLKSRNIFKKIRS